MRYIYGLKLEVLDCGLKEIFDTMSLKPPKNLRQDLTLAHKGSLHL
jgi:hypothetical protein